MQIKIKYSDTEMPRLTFIGGKKSDWIDVRAYAVRVNGKKKSWDTLQTASGEAEGYVSYEAGDTVIIDLGVALELPEGHEAHILPRSSTFKHYGLILTNGMGVVDESYCGDNDKWLMSYYAINSGLIAKYDRMGQFRIIPKMTKYVNIEMEEVDTLGNEDRGGIGTSGNK